jgi:aerobic-type carbon monoxide dehydrogenase small subunit (CoxS/CutS family)
MNATETNSNAPRKKSEISFDLNGKRVLVREVPSDAPLLWVLREHLGMLGTRFGCGKGFCGACTVHLNDSAARSCMMPISAVEGQRVTTIEGLAPNSDHPLQRAWIAEQVPQCGYCQSGQIMQAAALLASNPHPSDEEIVATMEGNLCRCGTYHRIKRAIRRAANGL